MADADWRAELDGWLEPFLAELGHGKRRRWAPVYLRGLLGPGERKSLQPMAARLGLEGHDQLHHFVASPAWDDAPLRRLLVERANALVGGPDAVLVVADTALPKQGEHSVGVARQYCGASGKRANCQVLVSLTLARDEVPVPVSLGLFLPEEWARDPDRCARAGVPKEHRRALAKTDLALVKVDQVIAAGARFGRVVADAGYGISAAFRRGLSERGLVWAVGIAKVQNVYSTAVELRWPTAATGRRPRNHPVPSEEPVPAEAALAEAAWRRVSWRRGTKGPLAAEFAAPSSRPCACARPRARNSGTAGTCRARRSGWWASAAPRARQSTISPTCPPRPRSRSWRRRSRPPSAGCRRPLLRRRIDGAAINGRARRRTSR
jgi:SRSO17 transposase